MSEQTQSGTVLIIGAGLGGLALAQSLTRAGVPFKIYERDASPAARKQGWGVGLHWILPELEKIASPNAPPLTDVSVLYGTTYLHSAGFYNAHTGASSWLSVRQTSDGQAPKSRLDRRYLRANRTKLRDWLLTDVDVNWGKTFERAEDINNGEGVRVWFTDGESVEGTVLVGADGSRSRVRTTIYQTLALPDPVIRRLPMTMYPGTFTVPRQVYERMFELGPSFWMATSHPLGFTLVTAIISVSPDLESADFVFAICYRDPSDSSSEAGPQVGASGEELLKWCKEKCEAINPKFKDFLDYQTPKRMEQPFHVYDREPEVLPRGNMTLLGDAMHPMSFFLGQGANASMYDGICLAKQLSASKSTKEWPKALRSYEKEISPWMTLTVRASREWTQGLSLGGMVSIMSGMISYVVGKFI